MTTKTDLKYGIDFSEQIVSNIYGKIFDDDSARELLKDAWVDAAVLHRSAGPLSSGVHSLTVKTTTSVVHHYFSSDRYDESFGPVTYTRKDTRQTFTSLPKIVASFGNYFPYNYCIKTLQELGFTFESINLSNEVAAKRLQLAPIGAFIVHPANGSFVEEEWTVSVRTADAVNHYVFLWQGYDCTFRHDRDKYSLFDVLMRNTTKMTYCQWPFNPEMQACYHPNLDRAGTIKRLTESGQYLLRNSSEAGSLTLSVCAVAEHVLIRPFSKVSLKDQRTNHYFYREVGRQGETSRWKGFSSLQALLDDEAHHIPMLARNIRKICLINQN